MVIFFIKSAKKIGRSVDHEPIDPFGRLDRPIDRPIIRQNGSIGRKLLKKQFKKLLEQNLPKSIHMEYVQN